MSAAGGDAVSCFLELLGRGLWSGTFPGPSIEWGRPLPEKQRSDMSFSGEEDGRKRREKVQRVRGNMTSPRKPLSEKRGTMPGETRISDRLSQAARPVPSGKAAPLSTVRQGYLMRPNILLLGRRRHRITNPSAFSLAKKTIKLALFQQICKKRFFTHGLLTFDI